MRRSVKVIFLCLIALYASNVKVAECSNEELVKLRKEANEVKMVLNEKQELVDPSTYYVSEGVDAPVYKTYFEMSLTNVTDDMYVEVKNDFNKIVISNKLLSPKDGITLENGVLKFRWEEVDRIVKFTYTIYGTPSSCSGEKLAVGNFTTPKYNYLSEAEICKGIEDYKYCSRFLKEDISYMDQFNNISEYKDKLEEEEAKKNSSWKAKVKRFIKQHKVLLISGASIIVVGGGTVVILKHRKKRVL